ncbi:nucleotidyl transferase AbiEii/AbiGii toxin family protein [Candidatus Micrarchaeota archaeon]|nr:nucleotidyl transferase AbiEii/AbiGii toxin family protein [Candidatus Micrarchaeota archaeon]
MQLNLEVCRTIATQHGLPLQYVVKEFHVFEVLGQMTAMIAKSEKTVFKGGTALNKIYLGGMQRFSEDLDFDLEVAGVEEARRWCMGIAGRLEGYSIGEFRIVGDTVQFYCSFDSVIGGKDHIRVDVAPKRIITSRPLAIKAAESAFTQRSVTGFHVYAIEDLVARKLHALQTRREGKDVYDVSNALPLCGAMRDAIAKMLESEGRDESPAEFIRKTTDSLKAADAVKLRNLTNPFIPAGNRPKDWLELKNDLVLRLERLAED